MGIIRSIVCVLLATQLGGCVSLELETCGDRYCNPGLVCAPDRSTCVLEEQVTVCQSAPPGTGCAYAGEPDGFCSAGVCIGALTAPDNVAASDGTSLDVVAITWDAVAGATSYRVFRDGAAITDVTDTSHDDADAAASTPPLPPVVSASQGTFTDRVELQWSAAETPAGAVHTYTVIALAGEMTGPSSVPDVGHRGAYPVTEYELSIDGAAFIAIGLATAYTDATAAAGTYAATVTASDGTKDHIALAVTEPTAIDGATRSYELRAVSAAGPGGVASDSGYRSAGAFIGYQWQRSTQGPDAGFVDVAGATTATHIDTTAPVHVTSWYRCVLTAANSDPGLPTPDPGWRVTSDTPRAEPYVIDGNINALVESAGLLYLGGSFTYVGRRTGSFVPVDTSGVPDFTRARIDGIVYAAEPDGAGGWYIGGSFTQVGGVDRPRLAHLLANGDLDTAFDPGTINADVSSLALSGNTLYVAGNLTSIGGQARNRIAAVDATTGAVTAWNPSPDGFIHTLVVAGGTLYVGGIFDVIGGQAHTAVAAFDVTTGDVTSWNPGVTDDSFPQVEAIAVSGSTVYLGGLYTGVGGQPRENLAAVDATTGAVSAWNPTISTRVRALAVGGVTLYVGGEFVCVGVAENTAACVGGQVRHRLAAYAPNAQTNEMELTAWDPDADQTVNTLVVSGSTVYLGGLFDHIAGQPRRNVAAVDATTGARTAWDPNAQASVYVLGVSGSSIYVGGTFDSIGGFTRNRLAALDVTTGELAAWHPDVSSFVEALAVSDGTVYIGGSFTSVGGQLRNRLAAVDATTAALAAWNPDASSTVNALAVSEGTVYVGGIFSSVGGQSRARLAAIDATTGAPSSWNPGASAAVNTLAVVGTTVYAGGTFTTLGGQVRNRLGAIDASTGVATAWNPNANGEVVTLHAAGDTLYVGGEFTSIAGQTRNRIASFAAASSTGALELTAWDPSVTAPPSTCDPFDPGCVPVVPTVNAIAAHGSAVYIGGDFDSAGGQVRGNVAALDATTGLASEWNPAGISTVRSLLVAGTSAFVGNTSFFQRLGTFDP